jgi:hypothetical protein
MVDLCGPLQALQEGGTVLADGDQTLHGHAGTVWQPSSPGAAVGASAEKLFQLQRHQPPCDRIRRPNQRKAMLAGRVCDQCE